MKFVLLKVEKYLMRHIPLIIMIMHNSADPQELVIYASMTEYTSRLFSYIHTLETTWVKASTSPT